MDDIMVKIFGWDYQLSLAYFGSMALFGLFCYAIGRQDGARTQKWKDGKIDFFDPQI